MALSPRTVVKHARHACLSLAAAGALYLAWRFDWMTLPEEGCSPVMSLAAGQRLLLDRRPPAWSAGDVAVFHGADDRLYLASVAALRGEGRRLEAWLRADAPDCPGPDSDELGWIPRADLRARVVMVLPW